MLTDQAPTLRPREGEIFIVAEIANAHEGSVEHARRLIDAAADAGADGVKMQVIVADDLATPTYPHYPLYQRLEISRPDWYGLVAHGHDRGLRVLADAFGLRSGRLVREIPFDGFKIPTADIANRPLLELLGAAGKPLLLSTGGCTWLEIAEAVGGLADAGCRRPVLLHGFQGYPTALSDSHLRRLGALRERFSLPVGFAGHVDGATPAARRLPLWAAAAGAEVLEVHITLDRSLRGLDYYSSLEPHELAELVSAVRELEPALGRATLAHGEVEKRYRSDHMKRPVTVRDLAPGEEIRAEDVALKRVPEAPSERPPAFESLIGRTVARPVAAHSPIRRRDLQMKTVATLACRAESSRLYGKPLQPLGDRPILQHLVDRLRRVQRLDEIVLAISDGPSRGAFVDFAERERLRWIAGDERDVLSRLIAAAECAHADIVLRTTTENPYVYWENLDELVELHLANGADLSVTAPLPVGSLVEVVGLDALRASHRLGEDRHRSELCTLFIAENPDSFTIQKIEPPESVQRPHYRLTVDTPRDLILVREVWRALHRDGYLIPLEEICRYLDDHPELAGSNVEEKSLHLWQ